MSLIAKKAIRVIKRMSAEQYDQFVNMQMDGHVVAKDDAVATMQENPTLAENFWVELRHREAMQQFLNIDYLYELLARMAPKHMAHVANSVGIDVEQMEAEWDGFEKGDLERRLWTSEEYAEVVVSYAQAHGKIDSIIVGLYQYEGDGYGIRAVSQANL